MASDDRKQKRLHRIIYGPIYALFAILAIVGVLFFYYVSSGPASHTLEAGKDGFPPAPEAHIEHKEATHDMPVHH